MALVSVQCLSIFVDLDWFLHLLPDLVLIAQHLDNVYGDWVTCQINVFLDRRVGMVVISVLLEHLAYGTFSLSSVLYMTHRTLHHVVQPTIFLQSGLILGSSQLGSDGV